MTFTLWQQRDKDQKCWRHSFSRVNSSGWGFQILFGISYPATNPLIIKKVLYPAAESIKSENMQLIGAVMCRVSTWNTGTEHWNTIKVWCSTEEYCTSLLRQKFQIPSLWACVWIFLLPRGSSTAGITLLDLCLISSAILKRANIYANIKNTYLKLYFFIHCHFCVKIYFEFDMKDCHDCA